MYLKNTEQRTKNEKAEKERQRMQETKNNQTEICREWQSYTEGKRKREKIKTEWERLQLHKLEIFHGLFVAHFMGPGWYRPTYLQSADGKQSI